MTKIRNIKGTESVTFPLYNNGLTPEHLETAKSGFLLSLIEKHLDLVKVTKNYPVDGNITYTLNADLILMESSDLKKTKEDE